jgi:hypothetical protein
VEQNTDKLHQVLSSRNAWIMAYLVAAIGMCLAWAKQSFSHYQVMDSIVSQTAVDLDMPPEMTQESIDLAMKIFAIKLPANTSHPTFDPALKDRGLTVSHPLSGDISVTIGPAAFENWALLGSTLAHEVEIHCRQPLLLVMIADFLGVDGTGIAEREAYRYELANQERFKLDSWDARAIEDTMNHFYPERSLANNLISSAKSWISSSDSVPDEVISENDTMRESSVQ